MDYYLLHQFLETTSKKYPDKKAIIMENKNITYKDLYVKSNKLAQLLANTGVQKGSLVGIMLEKSIETVISIFAVLKLGGIYIILDPDYSPISRLIKIINSCNPKHIISNLIHLGPVKENSELSLNDFKFVLIDNIITEITETISNNIFYNYNDSIDEYLEDSNIIDLDLAYILYTSGSTGNPKGVMISHLNAMTFVKWAINYFKPGGNNLFANIAPFNFDLSVFDIFVSIASGGTLHLLPFKMMNNPGNILNWIRDNKITYWYSVPSLWITILNYASPEKKDLIHLKNILFAGEVFPVKYLKQLMKLAPEASYFNLYGPTETNVCTYFKVDSIECVKDRPVPIGRACYNNEAIAINNKNEKAKINEEGELLVRGSNVTKGYFMNHEKTKEAFKSIILPNKETADFYKTGDIVKVCENGVYEYIGRKDYMVKRAGYRIELQEIEYALNKNPDILESAAIHIKDDSKDLDLICTFIKISPDKKASIIKIKKELLTIIPKYMIPDRIKFIDKIPKNENGKINRKKLREIYNN